jgi:hypothetical protein
MRFRVPVILAISVATVSLGVRAGFAQGAGAQPAATESATEDCLAKPGAAGPPGSHWYYRIDRATKRQCWYLGTAGAKARQGETRQTETRQTETRPAETRKHASTRPAPLPLTEQDAAEQPAAETPGAAASAQGTARGPSDPTLPIRAVPVQSLHMRAAPDQGSPAQALPDQALPDQVSPDQASPNQTLSAQAMSNQPAAETVPGQFAPVAGSAAAPTSNSYAEEPPASENEDDMPLVWPILTPAERAAAGLASGPSVEPGFMLVVLAGALAFAAVIARLLFKLFGTARADPRGRRRVVRDAPALRPAPPARAMPGHGKIVRRPSGPLQTGLGAEDDVRMLLRDLQRTAA